MKRLSVTLLAFLMIVGVANATSPTASAPQVLSASQVAKLDVSGKWTGKRNQYSADKKTFIESFQYEFDLKQEGNIITGTTTIINSNGEYADMQIEGVLVGNKLHFAEKEVKSAIRPEGKVWCFKSGELLFTKDGDKLKLVGATPSYMEVYNFPCSGGETDLVKVDNSNNLAVLANTGTTSASVADNMSINVFPNPFVQTASIYYNLTTDAKVSAEVYDMSGKMVTGLFEGNQKAGNYNLSFDAKNAGSLTGIFIIKLVVNGEVFSRQVVQMR
ncbi:MAG TPA: T9SS type A sorting domain-containing protein [Chitinophagales bacterium]|nr:T9SS type A sorting domain-containing protein [Chitinophagales bacterium]